MYPRYRRKRENPVEKAMRPGVLLLSLLIGFAIVFLFTPPPSGSPVAAEGAGEDYASAEEPEVHDGETDQETTEEDNSNTEDNNQVDDTADEDRGSHEGGNAGEDYEDEREPRPGDDEDDNEANHETDEESDSAPAATNADGEEDAETDDKRHRECIYVPGINTFHVIDDKHLTVSTSPRRIYLVTLWNRCFGLKWSHQIAIKSYSSWTCSHSRDTIITEDSRCIIDDIERVESNEAAENIVADRTDGEDDG